MSDWLRGGPGLLYALVWLLWIAFYFVYLDARLRTGIGSLLGVDLVYDNFLLWEIVGPDGAGGIGLRLAVFALRFLCIAAVLPLPGWILLLVRVAT